ncbi:uncharacterized protein LOC128664168 isoform X1 [Bombina bombina]|uniref:uncharacterized protein LOC128664168 isoform X1 n=1 Tax=Bombina bombina TaxID=8345 RepID=UPI00235A59DA|nr:uncharacterized protein LOC128664168 isoform X1 [Bombina bombina]
MREAAPVPFYVRGRCGNMRAPCKFSHDIHSEHNSAVLKNNEINGLNEQELKILLLQNDHSLMPGVCMKYLHDTCKSGNDCSRLHVCGYFLKGECTSHACKKSHNLLESKTNLLLIKYGQTNVSIQNFHLLCTVKYNEGLQLQREARSGPKRGANENTRERGRSTSRNRNDLGVAAQNKPNNRRRNRKNRGPGHSSTRGPSSQRTVATERKKCTTSESEQDENNDSDEESCDQNIPGKLLNVKSAENYGQPKVIVSVEAGLRVPGNAVPPPTSITSLYTDSSSTCIKPVASTKYNTPVKTTVPTKSDTSEKTMVFNNFTTQAETIFTKPDKPVNTPTIYPLKSYASKPSGDISTPCPSSDQENAFIKSGIQMNENTQRLCRLPQTIKEDTPGQVSTTTLFSSQKSTLAPYTPIHFPIRNLPTTEHYSSFAGSHNPVNMPATPLISQKSTLAPYTPINFPIRNVPTTEHCSSFAGSQNPVNAPVTPFISQKNTLAPYTPINFPIRNVPTTEHYSRFAGSHNPVNTPATPLMSPLMSEKSTLTPYTPIHCPVRNLPTTEHCSSFAGSHNPVNTPATVFIGTPLITPFRSDDPVNKLTVTGQPSQSSYNVTSIKTGTNMSRTESLVNDTYGITADNGYRYPQLHNEFKMDFPPTTGLVNLSLNETSSAVNYTTKPTQSVSQNEVKHPLNEISSALNYTPKPTQLSQNDVLFKKPEVGKVSEVNEICLFNIWEYCKFGLKCGAKHYHLPYCWQYFDGTRWKDMLDMDHIEKAYCDPNVDRIPLVDFQIMKSGTSTVRRLSTPSSVTKPLEFVLTTEWIWYWKEETGSWIEYGKLNGKEQIASISSAVLENIYLTDPKEVAPFESGQQKYEISFKDMMQRNLTFGTQREVRRRPRYLAPDNVSKLRGSTKKTQVSSPLKTGVYPTTWDTNALPELGCQLIDVSSTSSEYTEIHKMFSKTLSNQVVKNIKRIQNPSLWQVFQWQKEQMKKINKGRDAVECQLFHGTDHSHLSTICHHNFDWRICGTHGTLYGQGSYFARDASYSHSYSSPDSRGRRSMFVARVLVGDFVIGNSTLNRPPYKCGSTTHSYDSCVDQLVNPTIFVVFEKHQIYPEYILEYEEAKKSCCVS